MKTVIELVKEACGVVYQPIAGIKIGMSHEHLERFAALVREDERESNILYRQGFSDAKRLQQDEREKQQEPVAWVNLEAWQSGKWWPDDCFTMTPNDTDTPLYTTPPTAAIAASQMRDAAVKSCLEEIEDPAPSSDYVMGYQDAAAKLAEEIAALPIHGEEK